MLLRERATSMVFAAKVPTFAMEPTGVAHHQPYYLSAEDGVGLHQRRGRQGDKGEADLGALYCNSGFKL